MPTVDEIDALLPQTQCGECGYAGCRPYAAALAANLAAVNLCPPGGVATMKALGRLLDIDVTFEIDTMQQKTRPKALAFIREAECIGCTKCIQACPVDAIIGTAKNMHTILPDECTGCGLCIEPCPVDCIDIKEQSMDAEPAITYDPNLARARFQTKQIRLLQREYVKQEQYQAKRRLAQDMQDAKQDREAKQAYILQALARVKEKKL